MEVEVEVEMEVEMEVEVEVEVEEKEEEGCFCLVKFFPFFFFFGLTVCAGLAASHSSQRFHCLLRNVHVGHAHSIIGEDIVGNWAN